MSDVVVTVPKGKWAEWIAEGDLPGDPWSRLYSYFSVARQPHILPGERVYVVAHGRLRGYAPLYKLGKSLTSAYTGWALIRRGDAVAVTIPESIPGFRGFRYRWWEREFEQPFPDWQNLNPKGARP